VPKTAQSHSIVGGSLAWSLETLSISNIAIVNAAKEKAYTFGFIIRNFTCF
jgi:hypothetical protein